MQYYWLYERRIRIKRAAVHVAGSKMVTLWVT